MTSIAELRFPGERQPQMPIIHRCRMCEDTGMLRVDGEAPARDGSESEIWRAFMPCLCDAGDEHRKAYEWHVNRPSCDCGSPAEGNGFGPKCAACERKEIQEWRARRAA